MIITITLSPEAESKLRERAAATGIDVSRYASQLVERAMAEPLSGEQARSGDRIAAWDTSVADMIRFGKRLPVDCMIDDSCYSIYAGRGE